MKKNSNDKEQEKLKEVTNNFVQLDESLTENKQSKILETDKKLDFNISLNKDDIIIEDNNDYNKNNKNEKITSKIQIQNLSDKKKFDDLKKNQNINFNKISNNNNDNEKLEVKNPANYNSNEKINSQNSNENKNKLDLSFNNLVYDTLDEPVCDTLVNFN